MPRHRIPPAYQQAQSYQQAGYRPVPPVIVTRRPLSPLETCFHLVATVCSGGLWGFVWWSRVRGRRQITRYR